MTYQPINFADKLLRFDAMWSPRVIAAMNDYQFRLVKVVGRFVWHSHPDTDEAFIVLKGVLVIEFRDGEVTLHEGELFVVPRGVEHRPSAHEECHMLLIEPSGVVNTGTAGGERTVPNDVWI